MHHLFEWLKVVFRILGRSISRFLLLDLLINLEFFCDPSALVHLQNARYWGGTCEWASRHVTKNDARPLTSLVWPQVALSAPCCITPSWACGLDFSFFFFLFCCNNVEHARSPCVAESGIPERPERYCLNRPRTFLPIQISHWSQHIRHGHHL